MNGHLRRERCWSIDFKKRKKRKIKFIFKFHLKKKEHEEKRGRKKERKKEKKEKNHPVKNRRWQFQDIDQSFEILVAMFFLTLSLSFLSNLSSFSFTTDLFSLSLSPTDHYHKWLSQVSWDTITTTIEPTIVILSCYYYHHWMNVIIYYQLIALRYFKHYPN